LIQTDGLAEGLEGHIDVNRNVERNPQEVRVQ